MEDLRNRLNLKLVTNRALAERWSSKLLFDSFVILEDELAIMKMRKRSLTLCKPIYLG